MKEQRMHNVYSRREAINLTALSAGAVILSPFIPKVSPERVEKAISIFDKLINPLSQEAENRRIDRLQNDPEYSKRIDWELNRGRVNFLFFGYGQTFEPPIMKYPEIIGSHTVFSYDSDRKVIDLVSITHDTRAPEIERSLAEQTGRKTGPIKIDRAYGTAGGGDGGFNLQRLVLENATGLSIDFQIVMDDSFIVDMVDRVFGKIKINSPKAFKVNPFYYQGKMYPAGEFTEGVQEIDGLQAIQFIKTVVVETDKEHPDPQLEHNARKPLVIDGIGNAARENAWNPLFWKKVVDFVNKAVRREQIKSDFSLPDLLLNNMGDVAFNVFKSPFDSTEFSIPTRGQNIYIVDGPQGAGGVRWAKGDLNPIIREEYEQGFYKDPSFEVPADGNPYAEDLVEGYWTAVRAKVKNLIYVPA